MAKRPEAPYLWNNTSRRWEMTGREFNARANPGLLHYREMFYVYPRTDGTFSEEQVEVESIAGTRKYRRLVEPSGSRIVELPGIKLRTNPITHEICLEKPGEYRASYDQTWGDLKKVRVGIGSPVLWFEIDYREQSLWDVKVRGGRGKVLTEFGTHDPEVFYNQGQMRTISTPKGELSFSADFTDSFGGEYSNVDNFRFYACRQRWGNPTNRSLTLAGNMPAIINAEKARALVNARDPLEWINVGQNWFFI